MNITEIARLHGFSVGKVTGGSSIDGLVNDLVTGGVDKGLTAEQGKVLNQKKILEYGGILTGAVDFDNLTPNRTYQIGAVDAGSVGYPPASVMPNTGSYSSLEYYKQGETQFQRLTQNTSPFMIGYRVWMTTAKWSEWRVLDTVNTFNSMKHISNFGNNVVEKAFPLMQWKNNNVTSEYMDILLPLTGFGLTGLNGVIELTLSSSYANSNASGGAKVIYHIGANQSDVYFQQMDIVSISDGFASNFYISDWKLSGDKSHLYMNVTKKKFTNNMRVHIKIYNEAGMADNLLNKAVLTMNDHGSFVDLPKQTTQINNNVKVQKDIPDLLFATADGKKTAAIRLNANSAVDYGVNFLKDDNAFMVAKSNSDVQFWDATTGWFSVQSLKQSVSNGKANVAQAITDVGWVTRPDATFDEMASNIRRLGTVKEAKGTAHATNGFIEVRGIGFKPKAILCKAEGVSDAKLGNTAYIGDEWINGWSDVSMYVSSWDRNSIQSNVTLYDDGFRIQVEDANRNGAFGYYAVGRNI